MSKIKKMLSGFLTDFHGNVIAIISKIRGINRVENAPVEAPSPAESSVSQQTSHQSPENEDSISDSVSSEGSIDDRESREDNNGDAEMLDAELSEEESIAEEQTLVTLPRTRGRKRKAEDNFNQSTDKKPKTKD
ncbi:uncharacterized protein LOC117583465 isoform X2 [Drosophila guanche]|uniref:uncharacterized protein LOC117583465 isoform X2 n=1 Tax=Drosophila guanche TaxID=7266 RepID=UPI001471AEC2|nr:uncharacterized protein LOC117583465 isoform X2 [Drosophila guanche]